MKTLFAVACMLVSCTALHAQKGPGIVVPVDTCNYFYTNGAADYNQPDMPFDVYNTYVGLDSLCRSLGLNEYLARLQAKQSLDSALMFMRSIARAIDYDPLLFRRIRHELMYPHHGPYRIGLGAVLEFWRQRFSDWRGSDSSFYRYLMADVVGVYEVQVNDVTVQPQPGWLHEVPTGYPGDTIFTYCARCTLLRKFFGMKTPNNCAGWDYSESPNCMSIAWSVGNDIARPYFDNLSALFRPGVHYIVFTGIYTSRNEVTRQIRYALSPQVYPIRPADDGTGDYVTLIFEIDRQNMVHDPRNMMRQGTLAPYDAFIEALLAMIHRAVD
jgi:hypothetical protein